MNIFRKIAHCSNSTTAIGKATKMTSTTSTAASAKNRLQYEKSPYLLQHQSNPVDWYPWSSEAFELAKSRNKPIFLSVGYSTCHWCHVMERESFENEAIAKIMNEKFVNIKMDREERPDIDKIYMTVVQAISGGGGWPMSVWMTPDLKPIYAGTYFPPDDRYYGRPGFRAILEAISDQWVENEEKCYQSAVKIYEILQRSAILSVSEIIASAVEVEKKCIQQLTRSYEPAFGGFSEQPKFPQPVNLMFLMDWAIKNSEDSNRFSVVKMVETTLKEMAKGGIHDHIGQGFARYSTDKKWHVPHFEKMLYDQAQLTVAYSDAYLLTKNDYYAEIVKDILTYVGRDLSHSEGGFYSAEDADSYPKFDSKEKKEGAFYVWKDSEIDDILGEKQLSNGKAKVSDVFKLRYGIKSKGNVDPYNDPHHELTEQNVLYEAKKPEDLANSFNVDEEEIKGVLNEASTVLFNYRNIKRPRPGLDSKFVTSWNGLMITGYARAGMALHCQEYISRAVQAMKFLQKYVMKLDGDKFDLLRSCYRNDDEARGVVNLQSPIYGCVDDFANLITASIELYHATYDLKYLKQAIQLQEKQDELFWDNETGGYFTSRAGDASVIVRMKDDDDGAEPSSNSTSACNLIRLHSFTKDGSYAVKVEKLLKQFSDRLLKVPITLPVMAAALTTFSKLTITVVDFNKDLSNVPCRRTLLPIATVCIGISLEGSKENEIKEIENLLPTAKKLIGKDFSNDKTFVARGETFPREIKDHEDLSKFLY